MSKDLRHCIPRPNAMGLHPMPRERASFRLQTSINVHCNRIHPITAIERRCICTVNTDITYAFCVQFTVNLGYGRFEVALSVEADERAHM